MSLVCSLSNATFDSPITQLKLNYYEACYFRNEYYSKSQLITFYCLGFDNKTIMKR